MHRVFLLSPAFAGGQRAQLIFNPKAGFALAQALQRGEKRPLGEIFSFLSGLYFRGKYAYAGAFGSAPPKCPAGFVITPNEGLVDMHRLTSLEDLRKYSTVPIDLEDPRYTEPLRRSTRKISKFKVCEFVLLGSISTGKYVDVLLEHLGERLLFPKEFVGRGDMSRGGLLLRSVRDARELEYSKVKGAMRRGSRPPKLPPVVWKGTGLGVPPSLRGVEEQ